MEIEVTAVAVLAVVEAVLDVVPGAPAWAVTIDASSNC